MGKFLDQIAKGGDAVLQQRAGNLNARVRNTFASYLMQLDNEIADREMKEFQLTDLAPTSKDSLNIPDIDATKWIKDILTVRGELVDLKEQRKIAIDTYMEYFGDTPIPGITDTVKK